MSKKKDVKLPLKGAPTQSALPEDSDVVVAEALEPKPGLDGRPVRCKCAHVNRHILNLLKAVIRVRCKPNSCAEIWNDESGGL